MSSKFFFKKDLDRDLATKENFSTNFKLKCPFHFRLFLYEYEITRNLEYLFRILFDFKKGGKDFFKYQTFLKAVLMIIQILKATRFL